MARPRDDGGTAVLATAGARENSSAANRPWTALPTMPNPTLALSATSTLEPAKPTSAARRQARHGAVSIQRPAGNENPTRGRT